MLHGYVFLLFKESYCFAVAHKQTQLEKTLPSLPLITRKKKGGPLHSMSRLLIGCMKNLFLKLAVTIFGLD
jgi:hypothetical protein